MSRSKDTQILQKLIGVKKRRAEQYLAEIGLKQQEIDREVGALQQRIRQWSNGDENFDVLKLAVKNGLSERVAQRLERLKNERSALAAEMLIAENEMKVALHAECELRETKR